MQYSVYYLLLMCVIVQLRGISMHFFADGSRADVQRYRGLRRSVRARTAQATVAVAL